jgi:glycosyltransferase involved in cell wall biosynthesis
VKICWKGFCAKNHSWAVCAQNICRALIKKGHNVDMFSTNGIEYFPNDLKPNLIGYTEENKNQIFGKELSKEYDCQITYTAMKNFPLYLSNGNKNRFGIWCYEWIGKNVLPTGFAKNYKSCDYLCAPSNFAKQVFLQSNIPEEKIKVIPHGIDRILYGQNTTIDLHINKRFKILSNVAQNHIRKNIPGLLDAYGKAFTNKDNICLILKAKEKPIVNVFDISLTDCIKQFNIKYPNHAELKLFTDFIPDLSSLYRSVDATFTMSHCEGYYMVGTESIASGKLAIAPNYGAQLDFLNSSNALLIDGKEARAVPESMYWDRKNNAMWFVPSIDDAVNKLRYAYDNYEKLNIEVEKQREFILNKYSWDNVASQFLDLCI